jgi:hypothetical protein
MLPGAPLARLLLSPIHTIVRNLILLPSLLRVVSGAGSPTVRGALAAIAQGIVMLQPPTQTNSLFPTSLRSWQAAWRAERGLASEADGNTSATSSGPRRIRRIVRPRRPQQGREQA